MAYKKIECIKSNKKYPELKKDSVYYAKELDNSYLVFITEDGTHYPKELFQVIRSGWGLVLDEVKTQIKQIFKTN